MLVVGIIAIVVVIGVLIGVVFALRGASDGATGAETRTQGTSVATPPSAEAVQQATQHDQYQTITMAVESIDFVPAAFEVKAGVPVRWEIDATRASGCTRYIVAKDFGISQRLDAQNVLEFTPQSPGTYRFSCGMNMVEGTIRVV
jgi:plastocyanin